MAPPSAPPAPEPPPGDYELGPHEWQAWRVYLACERQWRVIAGMAGVFYDAIDNAAIESAMRMLNVSRKDAEQVLWMVRVLEQEARKFLNQREPNE